MTKSIGMYVRTKNGKIKKILAIYSNGDLFLDSHTCMSKDKILKASYDIKDLIIAGDLIEDTEFGINEVIDYDNELKIGLTDYVPSSVKVKDLEIVSVFYKRRISEKKV